MSPDQPKALEFPCEFSLKIFGAATDQFEIEVLTIIRKHVADLRENALRSRFSKDKKYLAITLTIHAESQEQLDALYRELSSNSQVLMVL